MKIGIMELIVILIIAFVVLGPERTVIYARKAGRALRILKIYINSFTEDIRETITEPLEELTTPLENVAESIKQPFDDVAKMISKPLNDAAETINDATETISKPLNDAAESIGEPLEEAVPISSDAE